MSLSSDSRSCTACSDASEEVLYGNGTHTDENDLLLLSALQEARSVAFTGILGSRLKTPLSSPGACLSRHQGTAYQIASKGGGMECSRHFESRRRSNVIRCFRHESRAGTAQLIINCQLRGAFIPTAPSCQFRDSLISHPVRRSHSSSLSDVDGYYCQEGTSTIGVELLPEAYHSAGTVRD